MSALSEHYAGKECPGDFTGAGRTRHQQMRDAINDVELALNGLEIDSVARLFETADDSVMVKVPLGALRRLALCYPELNRIINDPAFEKASQVSPRPSPDGAVPAAPEAGWLQPTLNAASKRSSEMPCWMTRSAPAVKAARNIGEGDPAVTLDYAGAGTDGAVREALEKVEPLLAQIAGKNDLSGIADDLVYSAACNALVECEDLAREALEIVGLALQPSQADGREASEEHPVLKHADELHELGFNAGWDGAVEECAKIVEGQVIHHRYREWPAASAQGNRENESEIVRHCDRLAEAIRSLTRPQSDDANRGTAPQERNTP
jgi:hypothetical protein